MITFWHLLLMLWIGGAIVTTYLLWAFAKIAPEDFDESGVTPPIAFLVVIFWPYSLFKAMQLIEHEMNWRKRQPKPETIIIPPPPEWCAECEPKRLAAIEEAIRIQTSITCCDECRRKQSEWSKKYCVAEFS